MTTGAGTTSNTGASPRLIDLLPEMLGDLFPDEADAEFRARALAIGSELAQRPPFLLDAWFEFIRHMERRAPKKFPELHGAQALGPADRRRLEPRLPSRRRAYILVVGALLICMDIPSLRVGALMPTGRVFGVGHKWLEQMTGLGARSVRRALWDLMQAGYMTSTQPIARYVKAGAPGGIGHAAWNAIYRFTEVFFRRIYRDHKLAAQRRRLAARRKDRVHAASLIKQRVHSQRARLAFLGRSVELLGQPTRGTPYRRRRRPPRPKP